MAVKRRSNWYIYLITIVITGVILSIVVLAMHNYIFPTANGGNALVDNTGTNNQGSSFKPDNTYNFTLLFMLGEEKGGIPDYFMTVTYLAEDSVVVCIPFTSNTLVGENTLKNTYESKGSTGVISAIKQETGLTCDKYVKFDKDTFVAFIDAVGNVEVSIPKDLTYANVESNTLTTFKAGSQIFSGINLYNYLTFPDYNEGDDYRNVVHSTCISAFINQNLRYTTENLLQNYIGLIINDTDTNINIDDFTKKKQAILYTATTGTNPAEYYIPYGDKSGDKFVIADASKKTILNITEQNTEN